MLHTPAALPVVVCLIPLLDEKVTDLDEFDSQFVEQMLRGDHIGDTVLVEDNDAG